MRTKLDHFPTETQHNDKEVRGRNSQCKSKRKEYHDKGFKTTTHTMTPGNAVIVKCENKRKRPTLYKPYVYVVIEPKGLQITAKKIKYGRTILWDATKFKPLRAATDHEMESETAQHGEDQSTTLPDTTTSLDTNTPPITYTTKQTEQSRQSSIGEQPTDDMAHQQQEAKPTVPQPGQPERLKTKRT